MKTLFIHHDYMLLPLATEDLIPVQVYGMGHHSRPDISLIGHPIVQKIKRLGVNLDPVVMDFLTISLAVTAADCFIKRTDSDDGWTRELSLKIHLWKPEHWYRSKKKLEKILHFLSGDLWDLEFLPGGYESPIPFESRKGYKLNPVRDLDCISLFSGGLDSAIGVIDLLHKNAKPLLVSHGYKGDKQHQDYIIPYLPGKFSIFSANADPHHAFNEQMDISMRTRSLTFLAFSVVGSNALKVVNQLDDVTVYVPENGLISLNAPLTPRRVGSFSTRTTHPHFINTIQEIFDDVGISVKLINPYQFSTKGEMVQSCLNQEVLALVLPLTVSCSHWKRKNQQCGCCFPCIIRRAAVLKGDHVEPSHYREQNISAALLKNTKDDLFAIIGAITKLDKRSINNWVMNSGPLPMNNIDKFREVFVRGMLETKDLLMAENVI